MSDIKEEHDESMEDIAHRLSTEIKADIDIRAIDNMHILRRSRPSMDMLLLDQGIF